MAEQDIDDEISSEDLKALLDKERREKAEAEARASAAESRAATAETAHRDVATKLTSEAESRYSAELSARTSELQAAESEMERLENELAAAQEAGDHKAAAKAQGAMSRLGGKIDRVEFQKKYLEDNKERFTAAPEKTETDPLLAFSPATRAWIGRHPKFTTDPKYRNRCVAYHNLALAEGLTPDTPEYFTYVEEQLGERKPDPKLKEREDDAADETIHLEGRSDVPEPKKAPAVTPVTRGGSPSGNRQSGPIRLTADEVESADITMSDVPVGDASGYYTDDKGVRQPGRYLRYHQNRQKLKAAGRI